jgi:hypothetical protein
MGTRGLPARRARARNSGWRHSNWDEPMEGVGRPWFECPMCRRRCRHLHLRRLACRRCSQLDYSSRHMHRSVPGLHRVVYLRRRIGAELRPFSPIAPRPRSHRRYHCIVNPPARGAPGRTSADRHQRCAGPPRSPARRVSLRLCGLTHAPGSATLGWYPVGTFAMHALDAPHKRLI